MCSMEMPLSLRLLPALPKKEKIFGASSTWYNLQKLLIKSMWEFKKKTQYYYWTS